MKKRFLAMLLVVCMVLSITPTSTFAEITPQVGEGNVCAHHIHDENCGFSPLVAQVDCDKNCTDTNDDGVIDHTADCASSPAVAANPCNFDVASCEICHPKNDETADTGTALPSETPVLSKTDAPTTAMATVAKLTAIQPSVSFVLDNQTAYTDTATWAVYDSETATTALLDIVASCNANTLTLAHKADLPVAVYYVAVTESGKAESARLALTVEGNVMPVALLGAAANAGEIALTSDVKALETDKTYTVSDRTELENLATLVNSAEMPVTNYTVKMLNDIDLSGSNWTPIGTGVYGFEGIFDGCGFEVKNLTINNSAKRQGLFATIGTGGVVQNVGVTGTVISGNFVGGVVGYNNGTVQNCYSTVNVSGNDYVGGVVGWNQGTIENCYSIGNVTGIDSVGGVVGFNGGTVQKCVSLGVSVLRTDNSVENTFGRVVGFNENGTLANNKARSDMLVNNATVTDGAANDINGENVTVSDSTTQASVFVGWDAGVWTIPAGNLVAGEALPTLIGFNGVQKPILPAAAAKEEDIPLDSKITTLKAGKSYTIADSEQLVRLVTLVNSAETPVTNYTVKMLNNIDLAGSDWTPIGKFVNFGNPANKPFAGTFDGCGFEVQNLTINNTSADRQGLFGYVGDTGVVQNVGVTGNVSGNDYVGGVVGYNERGTVQNCYSTVNVNGDLYVGGVVGVNFGTIQNCYNIGNVGGGDFVGGVVGESQSGTVQNCFNTGTVTGSDSVGGVVGESEGVTIQSCVSLGVSVLCTNVSVTTFGRVVGNNKSGTIANNKARGDMLVNNETVTGAANDINGENVTVGDSTNQTDVFVSANGWDTGVWTIPTGNLVAGATLPTLTGFKNAQNPTLPAVVREEPKPLDDKITTLKTGKIYTVADSGQLARLATLVNDATADGTGYTIKMQNDIDLLNSEWEPIGTCAKPFAGAFDGCGFEVKNLKINNSSEYYQGLFGYIANGGSVQNLGVTGNVIGSNSVGGVVGYNEGTVRNCYSTVNVSGTKNVGGVVGENYTTVKNCYSTGNVTGNINVGGVVGYAGNDSIQNCYSTGNVTGTNFVGGVVGKINGANVKVLGCVSLGSSVICSNGSTATNFGRVVGLNEYSTINNNKARSDMLVNNAAVTGGALDNINGADVTVGTTSQADVFNGWDVGVWTIPVGNLVAGEALPTLKGFTSTQNPTLPAAAEREIPLEASVSSLEKDKTYTVSDATQLAKLATLVNDATADGTGYTVKMKNDIDLLNSEWTPIGRYVSSTDNKPFNGTFDGNGFEVQNLTITNGGDEQGLFGLVGDTGVVQNVGVTGSVRGKEFVGGVVGSNTGSVQNCYSTVTVSGNNYVGGVVGENSKRSESCNSTIQNCYNTGTVSGNNNVGGVLGFNYGGTVKNCYNTGAVTSIDSAGGIVANNIFGGTVQNCYNTGTVSAGGFVGGVAGENRSSGSVLACVSLGTSVLCTSGSTKPFGKVVGENNNGTIANNNARGDMLVNNATVISNDATSTNGADVVVGTTSQADVFSGWNSSVWTIPTGALVANEALPTLKGFNPDKQNPTLPAAAEKEIPLETGVSSLETDKTYTVSDATQLAKLATLVNDATADGTGYMVKLLTNIDLSGIPNWTPIGKYVDGTNDKAFVGTFDGCGFEVKNLTINNTSANRQGLFGIVGTGGTVKNVGVTGSVRGNDYVSGVVGWNEGGTIQNCYNTCTVTGTETVGGVVGINNSGTVQNCYNIGTVTGTAYVGGIVGDTSFGNTKNCYNTGTVTGTDTVGGIAGTNLVCNIENCYNTGTVTGTDAVGGVIGKNYGGNAYATNCVSLGLAVLCTDGGNKITFGRIIGSRYGTNDSGNKARSDMLVNNATVTDGAANDINGEPFDVGDGTTQTSVFDSTAFGSGNGWNAISGNLGTADTLPTLAGFVSTQNPTVPQKTNISTSITFENGTAVYNGSVQTFENATTTAKGGNFTYTYAEGTGKLEGGKPKSAGTYTVTASYTSATETGSKTATFTITAKELTTATVTVSNDNFIYDGTAKTPTTVTVKDGNTTLTANTDYTVRYGNNRNAGTATVTVVFDGNYNGTASANFTIGKAPIAVISGTVTAKTYDGEKTAEVTALVLESLFTQETFTTTDYTVGAPTFDTAEVGTGKTVKGTATLVANGKTDNYTLTNGGAYTLKNCVISKGTYQTPPTKTISIKNGAERTGTITLADIFGANIPADGAFGTVTAPIDNKIMTSVGKSGDNLTYTSQNNAANTTSTDSYTVTVTTTNYADFDVTITFQAIDKTPVTISGLTATTGLIYNGKPQNGYTGSATVTAGTVNVTDLVYTYTGTNGTTYNETTAPTNAGSYKLVVAVADNNADYTGKHTDIDFTIAKALLDIKADDKNILIGEAKPTYTATATGLVNGESLSGVTFTDTATDTSTKGSFTITPTGCTVSGGGIVNYETSYSTGTLFINIDTSSIDTALAKANTAKAGVITSEGSADTVANGTKYVTAAEMKAIEDAITTATLAKTTVTNITDAKAAATTLDSAVATFTQAIKIGTKKAVTPPTPPVAPTATPTPAPTTVPTPAPTPKATDGGNNTQKPKPTEEKPTAGKTTAAAEVDADGKATVKVPEKSITDAITNAQQTAKKNGTEQNGISVEIEVTSDKNINSVSATLSEESIKELVDAGAKEVTFKSEMGDITLDLETLEQIQKEQGDDITITVSKADISNLDEKLKEEIGDRPVYELNLTKADGTRVTNFDGSITIAIPYTLQEGEDPSNIAVVYINEKGEKEIMSGSGYDEKTQSVIFTTRHFSTFAIVLMPDKIDAPITDIEQTENTTTDLGNGTETANTQGGISTGIVVTIVIAGILAIAIVTVGVVAIVKKRRE